MPMEGIITDIQRFCVHDGPGIRTAVFLKGCPLRCAWCHNPETQSAKPEPYLDAGACTGCGSCAEICTRHRITAHGHLFDASGCTGCLECVKSCRYGALSVNGRRISAESIVRQALADRPFYAGGGGITVTGGEPSFQPEFALEILQRAAFAGMNTCMETAGCFDGDFLRAASRCCGLFLIDVKDANEKRLRKNTGQSLSKLAANLEAAGEFGVNFAVRTPIIGGINDTPEDMLELAAFARQFRPAEWRLFSYHELGLSKAERLGRKQGRFGTVSQERLQRLREIFYRELNGSMRPGSTGD